MSLFFVDRAKVSLETVAPINSNDACRSGQRSTSKQNTIDLARARSAAPFLLVEQSSVAASSRPTGKGRGGGCYRNLYGTGKI
jgi:hypothetical protein